MDELKLYKKICEAIKIAQSNIDLEKDFDDIKLSTKDLEKLVLEDNEIIKKALEKSKDEQ